MPKLQFSLFGGTPRTAGVSQALTTRSQVSSAADAMRAEAVQNAGVLFAQGLQQHQERKLAERLARQKVAHETALQERQLAQQAALERENQAITIEQNALAREARARENEENVRFGRQQAMAEITSRLGLGAMNAGVPPGAVMQDLSEQIPGMLGVETPGPLPGPMSGGVPGGYMIGQQDSGYRGLVQEKKGYSKWEVPPPPPTEGDKDREWKNEVGRIHQELDLFETSAEGQKLMLPVKKSRMWALGLDGLPPREMDKRVVARFGPDYAPKKSLDAEGGTEDRSALDDLINWLNKPVETHVMGASAVAGMRSAMWGRYQPGPIDQALTERYGQKTARTRAEIEDIARRQILEEMAKVEQIGNEVQSSVQAPSLQALLTGAQQAELAAPIGQGVTRPVPLTKAAMEALNLNASGLPKEIQNAMSLEGYDLVADDTGTFTVVDRAGRPVPESLQAAVNATFNDPTRTGPYQAIRVGGELDPAMKRTSGEVKDATTLRGMKGGKPAAKPAKPQAQAAPEQSGTPADLSLRALVAHRLAAQSSKKNPAPPDASLGIPRGKLMTLLRGGRP